MQQSHYLNQLKLTIINYLCKYIYIFFFTIICANLQKERTTETRVASDTTINKQAVCVKRYIMPLRAVYTRLVYWVFLMSFHIFMRVYNTISILTWTSQVNKNVNNSKMGTFCQNILIVLLYIYAVCDTSGYGGRPQNITYKPKKARNH